MFIVSPPGIHISLGICVWGYTYHGDTHITVTPDMLREEWRTEPELDAELENFSLSRYSHLLQVI